MARGTATALGVLALGVLALGVLALAACGSTAARRGRQAPPAQTKACVSPQAARALRRIAADTAAIRKAARQPTADTLKGNAAINRATDRFLRDVELAPIDNVARNRLIDHAAAALVGSCEQCFQALEAERPLVSIAKGAHRGSCQK